MGHAIAWALSAKLIDFPLHPRLRSRFLESIAMSEDTKPSDSQKDGFLEEKNFKSRFVLITGEINDKLANETVKRLVALSAESPKPINVLVSSPGGHVESGDMIHDVIKFVRAPVNMIGTGWVASAGVHIYLSVPKERRYVLENTRFLIHQPSGGAGGVASDIAIQAKEIIRTRERLARIIARETGQTVEKVSKDIELDYWMSASEAIEYGLVGKIIAHESDLG
jgi:ATP-dependent Clp protease protease subunit